MGTRRIEIGTTGESVRANVHLLRKERGLTLQDLSALMGDAGRPMARSAINEIELGGRRVDVDDLVALATSLGVAPTVLLDNALAPPVLVTRAEVEEMIRTAVHGR